MKLKDVYEVTQYAVAQSLGAGYMTDDNGKLKPMDSFLIADVGKDLANATINGVNGLDVALKAMVDRLSNTYMEAREMDIIVPPMYVKPEEWGAFIQRVTCDVLNIIEDGMYRLVDGQDYSSIENTYYKPPVHTKVFGEGIDLIVPISVTKKQLKTAFLSEDELSSFVGWLYSQIEQTLDTIIESYCYMLLQCGIAISDLNTDTSIHLISEYNGRTGKTITINDCFFGDEAKEFQKYMRMRIAFVRRSMRKKTKAYNNKIVPTHTPSRDNICVMLDQMDLVMKMNLEADAFNKELLEFGEYYTIPAWQAIVGDDGEGEELPLFDFDVTSAVSIAADANNTLGIGTSAYNKNKAVCIVYDRYAMGQTIKREDVTQNFVASKNFNNTFHNLLLNYIIDTNYNMVSFFLD